MIFKSYIKKKQQQCFQLLYEFIVINLTCTLNYWINLKLLLFFFNFSIRGLFAFQKENTQNWLQQTANYSFPGTTLILALRIHVYKSINDRFILFPPHEFFPNWNLPDKNSHGYIDTPVCHQVDRQWNALFNDHKHIITTPIFITAPIFACTWTNMDPKQKTCLKGVKRVFMYIIGNMSKYKTDGQ